MRSNVRRRSAAHRHGDIGFPAHGISSLYRIRYGWRDAECDRSDFGIHAEAIAERRRYDDVLRIFTGICVRGMDSRSLDPELWMASDLFGGRFDTDRSRNPADRFSSGIDSISGR